MAGELRRSASRHQESLRQSTAPLRSSTDPLERKLRTPHRERRTRRQRTASVTALPTVRSLPQIPLPLWIKALVRFQQASTLITLVLVAGVLSAYGWMVYTQQRWGHAYAKLETLQRRERQLIATNEVLKNQMAQQAEDPKVGLVLPSLNSTIFLNPAPQRPPVKPRTNALEEVEHVPERPLGY